jgi:hypothetical protein
VGVDHTWYSTSCGSSWCRPMLNGDNPLSTSAVSACGAGNANNTDMVDTGSASYVVMDDFELLGACFSSKPSGYGGSAYISVFGKANTYKNIYIHGWTHTASADTQVWGFGGPTTGDDSTYDSVVVDGSDSDPKTLEAIAYDAYDVHNSVLRYNANGIIGNGSHALYNNLLEYIYDPYDANHGNVSEWNNEASGSNYVFNNVVRHTSSAVTVWICPSSGNVDYVFNNVFYDISGNGQANFFDVDPTCGNGTVNIFNNTWQGGTVRAAGNQSGWHGYLNSNFLIDVSVQGSPSSNTNAVSTTSATTANYGYQAAASYVPTTPNCNGNQSAAGCPVGKGANMTSTCNAIPDASVKAACLQDSTLGPQYDVSQHRVTSLAARTPVSRPSSGAWDAGAFQASGSAATVVNPPTGLTATVH